MYVILSLVASTRRCAGLHWRLSILIRLFFKVRFRVFDNHVSKKSLALSPSVHSGKLTILMLLRLELFFWSSGLLMASVSLCAQRFFALRLPPSLHNFDLFTHQAQWFDCLVEFCVQAVTEFGKYSFTYLSHQAVHILILCHFVRSTGPWFLSFWRFRSQNLFFRCFCPKIMQWHHSFGRGILAILNYLWTVRSRFWSGSSALVLPLSPRHVTLHHSVNLNKYEILALKDITGTQVCSIPLKNTVKYLGSFYLGYWCLGYLRSLRMIED